MNTPRNPKERRVKKSILSTIFSTILFHPNSIRKTN